MRHNTKFFAALLALLCLIVCTGQAAAATTGTDEVTSAQASTMHLEKTQGTVEILDPEANQVTTWAGMQLYSGYALETARESLAWLSLDKAKAIKLAEESSAQVMQSGRQLELTLNKGSLFFDIRKPLEADESLQIRTATMVTGIRGTSGWIRVLHESIVQVVLLEGSLTVEDRDPVTGDPRQVTLEPGQILTIVNYGEGELEEQTIQQLIEEGVIRSEDVIQDGHGLRVEKLAEETVPEWVQEEVEASPQLQERISEEGILSVSRILGQEPEQTPPPFRTEAPPTQEEAPGKTHYPHAISKTVDIDPFKSFGKLHVNDLFGSLPIPQGVQIKSISGPEFPSFIRDLTHTPDTIFYQHNYYAVDTNFHDTYVVTLSSDHYNDFTATLTFHYPLVSVFHGDEGPDRIYDGYPYSGYSGLNAPMDYQDILHSYTGTTLGGERYDSSDAPVDAGHYQVTLTFTGSATHPDATLQWDFSIKPRTNAPTVEIHWDDSGFPHPYIADGHTTLQPGVDCTLSFDRTIDGPGQYTVTVSPMGHNNAFPAVTQTFTADKDPLTVTVLPDTDFEVGVAYGFYVYGSSSTGNTRCQVTAGDADGLTIAEYWDCVTVTPTKVGTYTLTFTKEADTWYPAASTTYTFTVDKATPNIVIDQVVSGPRDVLAADAQATIPYTGNTVQVNCTFWGPDLSDEKDQFIFTWYSGDQPISEPRDPGTYTLTASLPETDYHYSLNETLVLTLTIETGDYPYTLAKTIDITPDTINGTVDLGSLFGEYGIPQGAKIKSISGPDAPSFIYELENTEDAITYKGKSSTGTDTYTVTLTADHYHDFEASLTFVSAKEFLVVTLYALDADPVYDRNSHTGYASLYHSTDFDGDILYTYTKTGEDGSSAAPPSDAGSYHGSATFTGSAKYHDTTIGWDFSILPRTIAPTVSVAVTDPSSPLVSVTCDGIPPEDIHYTLSYDREFDGPGTYTVFVSPAAGNYDFTTVESTFTIEAAAVDVSDDTGGVLDEENGNGSTEPTA